MHPTDEGIVREVTSTGTRETLAQTGQYVQSDSSLIAHSSGLLIVTGEQILELKLARGGGKKT